MPSAAARRCRGGSTARPGSTRRPSRPPGAAPRRSPCRRRAGRAPGPAPARRRRPGSCRPTNRSRLGVAQPRGQPGVAVPLVLAHVDADHLDVEPAPPLRRGQVAERREGQIGVAAAQVDDPQRRSAALRRAASRPAPAGTRRPAAAWRRCRRSPRTAGRRGRAGAPGPGRAPGGPGRRVGAVLPVHLGVALLGHPELHGRARRSPRASCRTARRAARRPRPRPRGRVPRCGCAGGHRRW